MSNFQKRPFELSQALTAASDVAGLFAVTRQALAELGCQDFTFAGSTSARLGAAAVDRGVNIYFSTLSADVLRANPGNGGFGASIFVRRFLQKGLDSDFSDPTIYQDATPAELAHREISLMAGHHRGYLAVLSRIPGHFTGLCCHLDALSQPELDRQGPALLRKILMIGQMMDTVFLSKHIGGHFTLSPREKDVLAWLAMGLRPEEIADRFGVGPRTVDKYIVSSKEKLCARTRDHAVARALLLGLIDL